MSSATETHLTAHRLIRLRQVLALTGKCRSSLYSDILDGRFVRPVKISARASAWPIAEVEALVDALIAEEPESKVRQLVKTLHIARRLRKVAATGG